MGTNGKKLIESVLVGYEVSSRLGTATKARPHVHSHGHWGTIGTAVSVAKLRDYEPEQVRAVINLAASMSPANSWTPAFKGATIRNLYSGRSGYQGILAVHLYECGFTGLDDGPADIFGLILGESFDPDLSIKGLGGEHRIQKNYFKFYACCRLSHPSVEAALEACNQGDFRPGDIHSVEINVPGAILEGMFGEYPSGMLAAKFNVPYAVAAAVVRGSADVEVFKSDAISDERIRDLTGKVRVEMGQDLTRPGTGSTLAQAVIKLEDGRMFRGETGSVLRGNYGNRVSRAELVNKFQYLTDDILGREGARAVTDAIDHLEMLSNVGELTSLLGG